MALFPRPRPRMAAPAAPAVEKTAVIAPPRAPAFFGLPRRPAATPKPAPAPTPTAPSTETPVVAAPPPPRAAAFAGLPRRLTKLASATPASVPATVATLLPSDIPFHGPSGGPVLIAYPHPDDDESRTDPESAGFTPEPDEDDERPT